ncbi:MAG: hypothetical protein HC802_15935, partial [Caldilineaceae bacterium]|nr:hypothetical protein [Caldilineaceae bacterium]
MSAIDMVDATHGWAAGSRDTFTPGQEAVLLYYNGVAWADVAAPTTKTLVDIAMLSNGAGGWA